jgi:hypothetical protein
MIVNWLPIAEGRFETRQRLNSKSQLDLLITQERMVHKIQYFNTTTENLGSDHFIIEFGIKAGGRKKQAETRAPPKPKYVWDGQGVKERYEQKIRQPLENWMEDWKDEEKWLDLEGRVSKSKVQRASEEISKIFVRGAEETASGRKKANKGKPTGKKVEDWEIRLKEATKRRRKRLKELLQGERQNIDVTHLRYRFLKAKRVVDRILDHRETNKGRKTWESVEKKYDARPGENFWKDIKAAVDPPRKELPRCIVQEGSITWKAGSVRNAWKRRFES